MTTNFQDKNLLDALKEKRKEIARRESKELFMIFHNSVLEATAEIKPATKKDLEEIKGWSKNKIEKYGNDILAIINGDKKDARMEEETAEKDEVLSVRDFIASLNNYFSSAGVSHVRGEITEVSRNPNGYAFFTIKDPETQDHTVSCFIGRWQMSHYDHLLEPGMAVVVGAVPSLYKNGRFSLTVSTVEAYGEGALKKAFEALKQKLEAKGYFDPSRKRAIPEFIQKIGLITSEAGAAIRDFRNNLGEYGFQIYMTDVRVEGVQAEQSIIAAIKWFNKNKPDVDVLVLIRGGGGLEDLKAFNSERIAEAIALSRLPILTGIGHERDETIADYVADRRFSTPTAVAAFIKTSRESLMTRADGLAEGLINAFGEVLQAKKGEVHERRYELETAFSGVIERYRFLLSKTAERMHNGLERIFHQFNMLEQRFSRLIYDHEAGLQRRRHAVDIAVRSCLDLFERKFTATRSRIGIAEAALLPLNPEAILQRGYSIVTAGTGSKVLKESREVRPGEKIHIKLSKGGIISIVEQVEN